MNFGICAASFCNSSTVVAVTQKWMCERLAQNGLRRNQPSCIWSPPIGRTFCCHFLSSTPHKRPFCSAAPALVWESIVDNRGNREGWKGNWWQYLVNPRIGTHRNNYCTTKYCFSWHTLLLLLLSCPNLQNCINALYMEIHCLQQREPQTDDNTSQIPWLGFGS